MASAGSKQRGIPFSSRPRKVRILLVDEDADDLKGYRLALEREGFEVITCSSFEGGKRFLNGEAFDFVLVGQGSVAFEGRTVLEHAVQADRHRPVLVVTRCNNMSCYLEAMQMGAVDYLEKPLAPNDLLRFVTTHVQFPRVQRQSRSAS